MAPRAVLLLGLCLVARASPDAAGSDDCADGEQCEDSTLLQLSRLRPGDGQWRAEMAAKGKAAAAWWSQLLSGDVWKVPKGDGKSFWINYVNSAPAFQGMAVELLLPGSGHGPQQALLDVGSSSISFCNSDFAEAVAPQRTKYAQCNMYANPVSTPTCPEAFHEWFYGSVYKGDVSVLSSDTGKHAGTMRDVHYAIMDAHKEMPCELGFDAIFGVAFSGLNQGLVPPPSEDVSYLLKDCGEHKGICFGNGPVIEVTALESPIMQAMAAHDMKRFGLAVDYMGTVGLPKGTTKNRGVFYVGKGSVNNVFYNAGSPQTVATYQSSRQPQQKMWWDFQLAGFSAEKSPVAEASWSGNAEVGACGNQGERCMFDSGNPTLTLPKQVFDEGVALWQKGNLNATISVYIYKDISKGKDTAKITLPIQFLLQEAHRGWLRLGGSGVTFGLPTWAYYYTVFDDEASTITWVQYAQM